MKLSVKLWSSMQKLTISPPSPLEIPAIPLPAEKSVGPTKNLFLAVKSYKIRQNKTDRHPDFSGLPVGPITHYFP